MITKDQLEWLMANIIRSIPKDHGFTILIQDSKNHVRVASNMDKNGVIDLLEGYASRLRDEKLKLN